MNQRLESSVVAVAAGVAAVAGSYAAAGFTPGFVVAPVSDFVVAATPDAVITWSIQTLGSLGQQLGLLLALVLTVGLFALAAGVQSLLGGAEDKSLDVAGIEPLVSEDFYQVDINNVDPTVNAEDWTLRVTGAVDEELEFDYDDLTELESEHRFVTLRCVGEGLNGKKMDTALWTGVPVMELLDEADLNASENCCVMLRAADDFFEEFPLSALRDGFLAYEMNGEPLPRGHGHPVRALIPGHWGEINVKWLTEIEVLEAEMDGYWEKRGWHGTGPVNTVAKLHAVNHLDDGGDGQGSRIQVGGHAYAGTRGIERVEVSTDGGETWDGATLSESLPGEDVWRQWEYTYEADGPHEVVVRATDGEGDLQPEEENDAFPSGPTGWVSRRVEP